MKEWLDDDVVWPNSKGNLPAPSGTDYEDHQKSVLSLYLYRNMFEIKGAHSVYLEVHSGHLAETSLNYLKLYLNFV